MSLERRYVDAQLYVQVGGIRVINASALLLMCLSSTMQHKADTSYHINAKRIMDKLISAAQKNGYKNSNAARKVFYRGVFDEFSIKTAYDICEILPTGEATRILADEGAPLHFLERGV